MRYRTKTSFAMGLVVALAGCSHPLPLSSSQEETISPEAAAFVKKSTYTNVPSFIPISTGQILKGREKFNASEAVTEDEMGQKFGLRTEKITLGQVPVLKIVPDHIAAGLEDAVALNIHGGGFVIGDPRDRSALLIAGTLGIVVYSIDYTMAPEAKFPVAIDQSLAVYKQLISEVQPERIIGVSSSAGGEIMLAMLQKARHLGLPMMKAQVLFTPAADMSGSGDSAVFNDERDVVSLSMSVRSVKEFYLGGADPKDPAVSPIYDTFRQGFPATVLVSGTRDLLLSNAVRLFWKLKAADVPAELLVAEGGWHGFHWEYQTPESIATMKAVDTFLLAQLRR